MKYNESLGLFGLVVFCVGASLVKGIATGLIIFGLLLMVFAASKWIHHYLNNDGDSKKC